MRQFSSHIRFVLSQAAGKVMVHRCAILLTALPLIALSLLLLHHVAHASYAAGLADADKPVAEYIERFHEHAYIANYDSKIFHKSGCFTLPNADKRVYFDDRTVAVSLGYRPCQNCNP